MIAEDLEAAFRRWDGDGANWASAEAWDDAFRCERLMVNLYDPGAAGGAPGAADRRGAGSGAGGGGVLPRPGSAGRTRSRCRSGWKLNRALLAGLTDDLQWHYSQRDLKRSYAHQAQKRVFWTFLVCLAIFALVMWRTFDFAGG